MSEYRPSPRPAFDRATALRRDEVTRHVWGDAESGEVLDWIYVSSSLIHQLEFGLPVGSSFRHSDAFPDDLRRRRGAACPERSDDLVESRNR
jgi:hypothetical protein